MQERSKKSMDRIRTEKTQDKYEEILGFIKKLIKKGNLRRLVIHKPSGPVFMEIPLTAGVVVGGIFLFFTPMLLALGALIALFKQVKVEIIKDDDSE
jgi:hypothetical protein